MKIKIFMLFLFLNIGTCITQKAAAQNVSVSFQVFYDDLSPYGTWVNSPAYGYVWIPDEGPGFYPYATNGYWAYTDYGWTWVSNYSWGWAPFHYGRWYMDPMYGYVWVPDNEWGPAWVDWRYYDGYYGWAYMGPHSYYVPDDHWTFVQINYFGSPNINNYYGPRTQNSTYIKNSTVINNTYVDNSTHVTYNTGPDKGQVEKFRGTKINKVAIKESNTPQQQLKNNELHIYKPTVVKNNSAGVKFAPKKVVEMKDVKPVDQRKTSGVEQPKQQPSPQNKPIEKQEQPKPQNKPIEQPKQQPPQNKPIEKQQPPPQNKPIEQPKQQPPQNKPIEKQQPPPQNKPIEQPKQQPLPKQQPIPKQQMPKPQPIPKQQPPPQPRKPK